jgi:hypothetical protein
MSEIFVIKAICRRIEDRYGSNRLAAMAANVSPGVWSNYCSDEHPETTIPMHRVKLVANAAERKAFADLLLTGENAGADDVLNEACEAVADVADVLKRANEAARDGRITRREAKEIRDSASQGIASLNDVVVAADRAANAA